MRLFSVIIFLLTLVFIFLLCSSSYAPYIFETEESKPIRELEITKEAESTISIDSEKVEREPSVTSSQEFTDKSVKPMINTQTAELIIPSKETEPSKPFSFFPIFLISVGVLALIIVIFFLPTATSSK